MSRDLVKKVIDGETYGFQQFGAKQALKVLTRLTKIVGEPMALAFTAAKGEGKLSTRDIDPDILASAVRALMERLDEDNVVDLVETLTASHLLCNGKQIVFDVHYEGKLGHLFKVLMAALEVQYGNFFGEFLAKQGIKNQDMPQALQT